MSRSSQWGSHEGLSRGAQPQSTRHRERHFSEIQNGGRRLVHIVTPLPDCVVLYMYIRPTIHSWWRRSYYPLEIRVKEMLSTVHSSNKVRNVHVHVYRAVSCDVIFQCVHFAAVMLVYYNVQYSMGKKALSPSLWSNTGTCSYLSIVSISCTGNYLYNCIIICK